MAMKFIESNFKKTTIWAGFDGRIENAFNYQSKFDSFRKIKFTFNPQEAKYYFVSTLQQKRVAQSNLFLPSVQGLSCLYNNNSVRLYQKLKLR